MNSVLFIEQNETNWDFIEIDTEEYSGIGWSVLFISELTFLRKILEYVRKVSKLTMNLRYDGRVT